MSQTLEWKQGVASSSDDDDDDDTPNPLRSPLWRMRPASRGRHRQSQSQPQPQPQKPKRRPGKGIAAVGSVLRMPLRVVRATSRESNVPAQEAAPAPVHFRV